MLVVHGGDDGDDGAAGACGARAADHDGGEIDDVAGRAAGQAFRQCSALYRIRHHLNPHERLGHIWQM